VTPDTNQPYPMLPPIGAISAESDNGDAATYLKRLARESQQAAAVWQSYAAANLNVYAYGEDPPPSPSDDQTIIIPAIQNAVISATNVQTKDPPTATLEPVETGEPPTYYWAGPPMLGLQLGLNEMQIGDWQNPDDGQMHPPQPIDQDTGENLQQACAAGGVPGPAGPDGMPTTAIPLKERYIVAVDDELIADTYQAVFDVKWARASMDREIRSNLLWTNIYGYTLWLYEWDPATGMPGLRPMSPLQVYIDPTVEDIAKAAYAGVDIVLDAGVAKRLYPQFADAIDREAKIGTPPKGDENTIWGAAADRNFERLVIPLRTFWIRNQPCPMTPEQAMEAGLVVAGEVPVVVETPSQETNESKEDGSGSGVDVDAAAPAARQEAEGPGGDVPAAGGGDVSGGPGGGGTGIPGPLPAASRPAFLHPDTGEELTPAHPDWPTYPCLRQITVIANGVVEDGVCPHYDIPLLHNVNIPIPEKPYGLGEPFRLRLIQKAGSRVVDAMVEYVENFKAPGRIIPQSVMNELPDDIRDEYVKPGQTLVPPDDMYMRLNGKLSTIIEPPPMPAGLMELHPILQDLLEKLSGHSEVSQGIAPTDAKSGKAIGMLLETNASMISFKSTRTQDVVWRLARLILHNIVHHTTAADVRKIVSKYPPHVLEAIHERARQMDWDVKVVVASGNGAVKAQKEQQAVMKYQAGLQSRQTTQEQTGVDPRLEQQRQAQEQAEMMKAQLAAGAGQVRPPQK
jgi:hypothetical protein